MNSPVIPVERVIGLDAHPDSFTAGVVRGPTPAAAIVEKIFNKLPIGQLEKWALTHTTERDCVVLEASGNSFHLARTIQALGRKVLVLESCHLGKLKEGHANNDKISAVRIAKACLAGTAKSVWIPDPKTQERRDAFHAHRKAVKRATQLINRLRSYLSDNGARLEPGFDLQATEAIAGQLRKLRAWTPRQWIVVEGLLMELRHAQEQHRHWSSVIAQDVASDPLLLSLVRLVGVREIVAFAFGAFIGEIGRFSSPKSLVKYVGLNPAFDDSGEETWHGGIGGHGNKALRALVIESAQSILRSRDPLARWGKKLLARKGSLNLVVAAVARKLVVAVWYLMNGRYSSLQTIDLGLKAKLGKILAHIEDAHLQIASLTRRSCREQMHQTLLHGRVYQLEPPRRFIPKARPGSVAAEYGLA